MDSKKTTDNWYTKLIDKVQFLIAKYGLPEDIAADIRGLTVEIAKDQFKAGNHSGIVWLKRQQAAEGIRDKATVAA